MPPIPHGDPWPGTNHLLDLERALRERTVDPLTVADDDIPYWGDLVRLLALFALWRGGRFDERAAIQARMRTKVFDAAIVDKAGP